MLWTVLLLLAPCAALAAQQPPLRSARIVTDFGGAVDDPAAEMLRVTDVVRTTDGRFVVANGKPLEVRLYDAKGALQARLGREGNGPGEYRYGASLASWPGDSVAVYSQSGRRWMLFALDRGLVREWPLEADAAIPGSPRVIGSAFARTGLGAEPGCAAATIRRLAPTNDSLFRQVMVDGNGRIWLRPAGGSSWTVHGPDGLPIARVAVPGRFSITALDGGDVIGVRLDEDDFPHVTVLRTGLPEGRRAVGGCVAPPREVVPRASELKTAMRNLMTAEEAFYSRNRRYVTNVEEFGGMFSPPARMAVHVVVGTERGFAVMARNLDGPGRCVVSVGQGIPDWPDGYIGCGT